MHAQNDKIARLFERVADLLEAEGANPFRVRAYRNAAWAVRGHAAPMAELLEQGVDLSDLQHIGKDLAGKIQEIVETGELALLREIEARSSITSADESLHNPGN